MSNENTNNLTKPTVTKLTATLLLTVGVMGGYIVADHTNKTNIQSSSQPPAVAKAATDIKEALDLKVYAHYPNPESPTDIKTALSQEMVQVQSNQISEALGLKVYAHYPIPESPTLLTVFTENGTFIVDNSLSFAFRGKMINLSNGNSVTHDIFLNNRDEIESKIQRTKAIEAFSSNSNSEQKVQNAVQISESEGAHETGTTGRLNQNHVNQRAKEILMKSPGVQALLERERQKALANQENEQANVQRRPVKSDVQERGESSSLLVELKNLQPHLRKTEGPKYSPKLIPQIPDSQFIVYPYNPSSQYRGTLTVATDYTCGYCKLLHGLVEDLNNEGVTVRYMPYPRANIINYSFPEQFTIDDYVARNKLEPLSEMGKTVAAAYCSADPQSAYNSLFNTRTLGANQPTITTACDAKIREFKILGDLMFSRATPYMVWGDSDTPKSERGFIEGIYKTDKTIDDLLRRIQREI